MKKKIYDGSAHISLTYVLDQLSGSVCVGFHHKVEKVYNIVHKKYYHVDSEGITLFYRSEPIKHQARIYLYGAEEAVEKLEQRILQQIEKVKKQ